MNESRDFMRSLRLILLTGTILPGLAISPLAAPLGAEPDLRLAQAGEGPPGAGRGERGGPGGAAGAPGGARSREDRPERPDRAPAERPGRAPDREPAERPSRAEPPRGGSERPTGRSEQPSQERQPAQRAAPPAEREERPSPRTAPAPERRQAPATEAPAERARPPAPEGARPSAPRTDEGPASRTAPERRQAPTTESPAERSRPAAPDAARPGATRPDATPRQPDAAPSSRPDAAPRQPDRQPDTGPARRPEATPDRTPPAQSAPAPQTTPDRSGQAPLRTQPSPDGAPGQAAPPPAANPAPNAGPGVPGRPFRRDGQERDTREPVTGGPATATEPRGPSDRSDDRRSDRSGFNDPGRPGYVPGGFREDREPVRNYDSVRRERREYEVEGRTYIREPGRVIVRDRDGYFIRHDESERFRDLDRGRFRSERRGSETYSYLDRPGGEQIITIVDDDGRLLRRSRRYRDGREVIIIDNGRGGRGRPIYEDVVRLPPLPQRLPRERYVVDADEADERVVYETLTSAPVAPLPQRYSLDQVRASPDLRNRMPSVDINTITFDTASFTVTEDQAPKLAGIAAALNRAIKANPQEVYLVEGYTDAVGSDIDNLSLSDRRAQSVATVLTERFGVPPENLTTQGYGEQYLKVETQEPSRENRRVAVRRVTPLIQQDAADAPR